MAFLQALLLFIHISELVADSSVIIVVIVKVGVLGVFFVVVFQVFFVIHGIYTREALKMIMGATLSRTEQGYPIAPVAKVLYL